MLSVSIRSQTDNGKNCQQKAGKNITPVNLLYDLTQKGDREMRILIIGSGAIGTFIGGALIRAKQDVVFFDLPNVVERITTQGLKVEGIGEDIIVENPRAISRFEKDDHYDLAVVSVKSYSTAAAISGIPDNLPQKVLSFQNGIENEDILAAKFGKQKIIAGTITYPVAYPEPGQVKIENQKGGLGFAPMDPALNIDEIPGIFEKTGLNVAVYDDYRSMKWSKLMLNIVCNASCAILGMTPGEVFSDRRLVWIERESILELLRVMKKKNIKPVDLPGYPVQLMKTAYTFLPASILKLILYKKIEKSRGKKKPSLLIEVERGSKLTEVGMYNGAIVRAAEKIGLKAPVNKVLTDTLDGITSGDLQWEDFREKPKKLYEKIKK